MNENRPPPTNSKLTFPKTRPVLRRFGPNTHIKRGHALRPGAVGAVATGRNAALSPFALRHGQTGMLLKRNKIRPLLVQTKIAPKNNPPTSSSKTAPLLAEQYRPCLPTTNPTPTKPRLQPTTICAALHKHQATNCKQPSMPATNQKTTGATPAHGPTTKKTRIKPTPAQTNYKQLKKKRGEQMNNCAQNRKHAAINMNAKTWL